MADALAPLGMQGARGKHRRDTKRGRDCSTPTNSDIEKMTPIVENSMFTVKLQRIQIQTLTDDCLRSILTMLLRLRDPVSSWALSV